jgi:hemin uptake protein HemP
MTSEDVVPADLAHKSSRTSAPADCGELPVVDSADLFRGATELRVRHRGDEYRLRITRQGKLILTK